MQKSTLRKLGASVVTGALVLTGLLAAAPAQAATKTIGIAYSLGGRDVPGFNQLAYIGVKPLLAKDKSLKLIESQDNPTATDDQRAERLRLMAKKGANPIVVVGFTYAAALGKVSKEFPKVQWGIVDDSSVQAPNVQGIVFKEEASRGLCRNSANIHRFLTNDESRKLPISQKISYGQCFSNGRITVSPNDVS